LTHNKLVLCESNAILTYLCEAFPNEAGKYTGTTIEERAMVQQYLSWYQGSYRPALLSIIRLKFGAFRQKKPVSGVALAEAEKKIHATLDLLDSLLAKGNPYIAGENLTIADLLIFSETTNVESYKLDLSPWKNVKAWYDRVLTHQAIADIHAKFREGVPRFQEMLEKVQV
jgi:glutathione S-transferase